jgi:uncharacterized protein YraI
MLKRVVNCMGHIWHTWRMGSKGERFGGVLFVLLGISLSLPVLSALGQSSPQSPTQMLDDQILYLPLIPVQDNGNVATPTPTPVPAPTSDPAEATGPRVYGLLGTLERQSNRRYSYYLSTANSGYYALAGESPEIEERLADFAAGAGDLVKVWGSVLPPEASGEPPLIVVTGILSTEVAVPTPVAGASVPVAVVKFQVVNLYAGPGSNFPAVGQVVQRQACEVTGRNQTLSWLQLTCTSGQQGWVDARLVEVTGDLEGVTIISTVPTATPPAIAPTSTPSPTPMNYAAWRTELFPNATLAGAPVAVVDVPAINFNWGSSAPSQLPTDGFSVRFARRITVSPGFYQFTAVADDGVRVWLDGQLIINAWPANPSQSYVVGRVLTGSHDLLVEYYEQSGLAAVRLEYAVVSAESSWQASYYYGVTPSGNPAFTQEEPRGANPLDYNWSTGSPPSTALGSNVVGNDYWSGRWQGDFQFEGGNYVFRANVDDGIRLYLDGILVLNHWRDGYKEVNNRVISVGPGRHTVVVEYYERTGNASLQVWWSREGIYVGPQ